MIYQTRSKGNKFSWVGKRYKYTIQSCLDRAIVNSKFLASYPVSESEFLGLYGHDHRPVVMTISIVPPPGIHKHFRFDKRLLTQPNFKDYISQGWYSFNLQSNFTITDQIRECWQSLVRCRRVLKLYSTKGIEELQLELEMALTATDSRFDQIPSLQTQLATTYREEEIYWK